MAILDRIPDRRILAACLAVGVAAATGCSLLIGSDPEPQFAFRHSLHVGELELDCFNCHADAFALDDPGMPEPDTCAACHDELDTESRQELRVDSLFDQAGFAAKHVGALSDELIFSHQRHVEAELECIDCHAALVMGELPAADTALRMADCTGCHQERRVVNDCTTCHTRVGREWAPPSHFLSWTKNHGKAARAGVTSVANECSMCHQQSSCTSCHLEREPDSHDTFFRRRGHAVLARIEREQCAVCHQPDSCQRCHETTRPVSHAGSWSGSRNTHCVSCHFPLRSEGCVLCHDAGAPHELGAAKPADHHPAMNCRQCHGLSAPLPHVDKGDDCNACHP